MITDKERQKIEAKKLEEYVITCGDEGVQINVGKRLGFIGCGYEIEGFSKVVKALKKLFKRDFRLAINQENEWIRSRSDFTSWKQINAAAQKSVEAIAKEEDLLYAGYLPFTDPRQLKHDIKGHMVRPHDVHVANSISFTLDGGEIVYNLGHFVISADWVHKLPKKLAEKIIKDQVKFYKSLVPKMRLKIVFEEGGILGEKIAKKNRKALNKMGIKESFVKKKSE